MNETWFTSSQWSILLEVMSFLLLTPALYGEPRIRRMEVFFKSIFDGILVINKNDIMNYILNGKYRFHIRGLIFGLYIFIITSALVLLEDNIALCILSFVSLPIILHLVSFFLNTESKRHLKMWAFNIILFPTTILLKILQLLAPIFNIVLGFWLGTMTKWFYGKNSISYYPLIIAGFILFLVSKYLAWATAAPPR